MSRHSANMALLRTFWRFVRPDSRAFYISLGLMIFNSGMFLLIPIMLQRGLDRIGDGDQARLMQTSWLLLAVVVVEYLSKSGFSYLISVVFLRTINRIREHLFSHVIRMKMAFFDREPVGRLLTRTINDCESLGETLRAGIATIFVDILNVIVVFALMLNLSLELSGVLVIAAPLLWFLVKWCGAKLREIFMIVRKALAEANGYMAEGINGVEILQLFKQVDWSSERFRAINADYRRATIVSNVYDATLYALIDGIAALVTAAMLFTSFNLRFGLLEVSVVIVCLTLVEKIFVPIRDFSGKFATIQQALAALERIFSLIDQPAHIVQGARTLDSDRLDIRFEGVSFKYREDGPQVLKNVDLAVASGQVTALVGQTGSGKSTIGKLLTRAYDGYTGTIRVGGIELRDLNYHSLRSKVAVVHQEVELFPGTLRENITMFHPEIGEDRIVEAVRLVKAEHLVAELPGGLDFPVQENGGNLSSGQMQLIIFARALAHDAPIILMDEATSNVDSVTEAWIQEAIFQIFKHKTVLIVAHRLSTIAAADKILVLKHGEVIEEGTHRSLVALKNGYYARLVHASQLQGGQLENVLV